MLFLRMLFVLGGCVLCCSAFAMRCGDQLVDTGDNQFTIVQKCGEPKDKQRYEEVIPIYNAEGAQVGTTLNVVERWIYQRSPADFQYTLVFDAGILKDIETNRNAY